MVNQITPLPTPLPNEEAIRQHLNILFRLAMTEYPEGLIELRTLGGRVEGAYFQITEVGIEEATIWADERNRQGKNVYVGVNPRKPGIQSLQRDPETGTQKYKAASSEDVEVAFFNFADLDAAESIEIAQANLPIDFTMSVQTGSVPHTRAHLYWQLDDPNKNLPAWRQTQSGLAKHFGSDSVIDPPRIMRLAGTVSWPNEDKQARGYVPEVVTLQINEDAAQETVPAHVLQTAFRCNVIPLHPSDDLDLSGIEPEKSALDMANDAIAGSEWHNNMLKMVGSMVASGTNDEHIILAGRGLKLPGYTIEETDAEVKQAIKGARRKGWATSAKRQPFELNVVTAKALQGTIFDPVKFIVPDYVPEGLTLLAGRPKIGKSWMCLDIAIGVASGTQVLGSVPVTQGQVLYAALEDNRRRLQRRMSALCPTGTWPSDLELVTELPKLDEGGVDAIAGWIDGKPNPRLIIIDTLQKVRSGKGTSENSYEADYGALKELFNLASRTGVAIIIVHHVRKMPADDPLDTVSGTTGLTGAADTILVLNRASNGVTLYGRGRDIDEIDTAVEFDKIGLRWKILGDAAEVRQSDERKKIRAILEEAGGPMGPSEIAELAGMADANVRQMLGRMTKDGQLEKKGRGKYALAKENP